MRRWLRTALAAVLVLAAGAALAGGCAREGGPEEAGDAQPLTFEQERERAIQAALEVFRAEKAKGADLSAGPCIAQEVIPNWAADVAHEPRQPVDDLPENQCASFREGRVGHFVELDPDGNLIRAQ